METLPTKLPHEYLAIPIQIFEPEIILTAILGLMLIIFLVYTMWRGAENDHITIPKPPKKVSRQSERDLFRKQILALQPESLTFGDQVAIILRKYIASTLNITLSPSDTVAQMQGILPPVLGGIFEDIRNIRYAKKEDLTITCSNIQSNIIELIDRHAI
ncbi:MAG: hypothetical protein PHU93_02230 [Candidatus Gracilibacteria bacterium]|nr:hypothetical protein [Candidatus Gracilibacteria bacterium]